MKVIAPKRLMRNLSPIVRNGDIFNQASLDLEFARTRTLDKRVTHTRASNATYVDGDGIIKDAVTNLLLHSEPDTALTGWIIGFSTGTFSHTIIDSPFAVGEKAVKHVQSVSGRSFLAQSINVNANTTYTASFYVDKTQSQITSGDTVILAVSNVTGGTVSGDGLLTFSNAVNGKNTITFTTSSGVSQFQIRAGVGVFGNSTGTLVFGNLQLEKASTAGEYVKTTSTINSAPRFDHNPTTGESLGLLVEESRTNEITNNTNLSSLFTGSATRTNVTILTPDGDTNGHAMLTDASAFPTNYENITTSGSNNEVDGTVSFYAKKKTAGTATLTVTMEGGGVSRGFYIGAINSDTWTRVTATKDYTGATSLSRRFDIYLPSGNSSDGDTEFYICFLQFENGSFPTSYIRTSGSTVTRSPDVTSIEGNDFGTFNLLQYSEEFDQSVWAKVAVSVTANQRTAPDGTLSMDTVTVTGGAGFLQQAITVVNSTVYTASTYVYADSDKTRIIIHNGTSDICNVSWTSISANTTTVSGTASNITSTDVGNGIYRLTFTFTSTSTTANYRIQPLDSSGNAVVGATGYFWGAQLEESSTATPYVKSDVTWTSRASNATYYDYTGTLRKSSYNRITNSEDLTGWAKTASVTITADAIEAPDGTTSADRMDMAAGAAGNQGIVYKTLGNFTNADSVSFYAKAGTLDNIRWIGQSNTGTSDDEAVVQFNLTTGEVVLEFNATGSMTAVGNGWYRCFVSITSNPPVGYYTYYLLNASDSTTAQDIYGRTTYTYQAGDNIYLWGAQLEAGPYAGDYVKTEGSAASSARNVAFLPDGNGNFVSAGELLLEDAGTNLLPDSETIGGTGWYTLGSGDSTAVATVNAAIAPNGTQTASRIDFNRSSTSQYRLFRPISAVSATGLTQGSVFVKAATASDVGKVIDLWQFQGGVRNQSTATLTNEWQRVSLVNTYSHTGSINEALSIGLINSGGGGELSVSVLVWGAQVEESPYPTSYIPTYGSTATRAADVSSSSSNTFGNSFYNQTEGTVFSDTFTPVDSISGLFNHDYTFHDGTNTESITIVSSASYGSTGHQISMSDGGSNQFSDNDGTKGIFNKFAIGYKLNDTAASANSSTPSTDTSCTIPLVTKLSLGGSHASGNTRLTQLKRLTYWPTRLSNDTLKTITA